MPEDEGARTPAWLKILLAAIPVVGLVVVGYWQFVYNRPQPEQKTISYTGRVRDDGTNSPVYKAKVSVEEDQKVPQVQETDSEGIFHVSLPETTKEVRVVVEAEGYELRERRVSLRRTGIEDIRLRPSGATQPTPTPSPTPGVKPNRAGGARRATGRRTPDRNCNADDILLGRC